MVSTEGRLIRPEMKYEREFMACPNSFVRDEQLTYRARGILVLLLSHKTGFSVTIKALASASPREGLDAIRAAVVELEEHGYLRRYSSRRGGQFRADDWELTDPSQMILPSLLTALDKTTRTALDNPTREDSTALDKTTRTALDNPTTRRKLKEELLDTQPSHRADLPNVAQPCPSRKGFTPCSVPESTHVCLDCGQAAVPFAQPILEVEQVAS